jgi:hypothetical protein
VIVVWIDACDIDGVKMYTLGPRLPPVGGPLGTVVVVVELVVVELVVVELVVVELVLVEVVVDEVVVVVVLCW